MNSQDRLVYERSSRPLWRTEKQTGIVLANHPLAEQLQDCVSVESVTNVFREQTQAFSEFRGRDKIMRLLKNSVSVLYKLTAVANLGQDFGLVRP